MGLAANTKPRFDTAIEAGKARRFNAFLHVAKSGSRVERFVDRVEIGAEAPTRVLP